MKRLSAWPGEWALSAYSNPPSTRRDWVKTFPAYSPKPYPFFLRYAAISGSSGEMSGDECDALAGLEAGRGFEIEGAGDADDVSAITCVKCAVLPKKSITCATPSIKIMDTADPIVTNTFSITVETPSN